MSLTYQRRVSHHLQLDIEGAEHSILAEMIQRGLMRLVDVLTLECHAPRTEPALAKGSTCAALLQQLAQANPMMRLNPLGADGMHAHRSRSLCSLPALTLDELRPGLL